MEEIKVGSLCFSKCVSWECYKLVQNNCILAYLDGERFHKVINISEPGNKWFCSPPLPLLSMQISLNKPKKFPGLMHSN